MPGLHYPIAFYLSPSVLDRANTYRVSNIGKTKIAMLHTVVGKGVIKRIRS